MTPLWTDIAAAAGVTLSADQLAQLDRYLDLLIETNQVMNLTRIVDRADAEVKHVTDALTLLPHLPPPLPEPLEGEPRRSLTVADVGTGGGIPGVILAIARPDFRVTLIDSTAKKLAAVKTMCDQIGLKNVSIVHNRIEQTKLKFDVVTARGVAALDKLLGWCGPLLKPSSVLLAMKGPRVAEEMLNLPGAQRRMFTFAQHAVAPAELAGHVIVEIRPAGRATINRPASPR